MPIELPAREPRKETETPISRRCREAVAKTFREVRITRNNNGRTPCPCQTCRPKLCKGCAARLARPITFGLGDGSPDLVGVATFETMYGPIALAFGLEVKQPGRYPSPVQRAWHASAARRGLPVEVVRSPEEAVAAVERILRDFRLRLEKGLA
jgi:hypothetical protein